MEDYLKADRLTGLLVEWVGELESLFQNPTKHTIKDANKDSLEEIVDNLNKMLRHHKQPGLTERIQLLGATLGMAMLKMTSIEKRITGCKIISRFSYEMLYRSSTDQVENAYTKWVVEQGFFDMVFEDHSQGSLIKAAEETFKLLVKKSLVTKPMYCKFF